MATETLPSIAKDDYEAIKKLAPDLPDTFVEWQGLHEKERRERNELAPVELVQVRPAEFDAYCNDRGVPGSSHILLRFAIDNAGPHESVHDYDPLENERD